MGQIAREKIIVLYCPSCTLPVPFEDYDGSGIFIGKCAICGTEYQAKRTAAELRFLIVASEDPEQGGDEGGGEMEKSREMASFKCILFVVFFA